MKRHIAKQTQTDEVRNDRKQQHRNRETNREMVGVHTDGKVVLSEKHERVWNNEKAGKLRANSSDEQHGREPIEKWS